MKNTDSKVIQCYDLLDAAIAGGVHDFTDGKYYGNPDLPYKKAQFNQAEWLLDQIKCVFESHILDVGCGNGRILLATQKRGAVAEGITISSQQLKRNRKKGLNAYLMNYQDIPETWNNRFDGIIANGAIEHFVQVKDALAGKQDNIYRQMFKIFYRILKPGGYLATTVIHFNKKVEPREIIKGSKNHKFGSDNFHFAKILQDDFGGWYPIDSQLEKNAHNLFKLVHQEDGTEDYHWTSEYWLRQMKLKIKNSPLVWLNLSQKLIKHPLATVSMLNNLIFSQSWMWQFRKNKEGHTPVKLYRQVWQKQ